MQQEPASLQIGAQPTYPDLVQSAGELFHSQISALAEASSGSLRDAARLLAFSLERALRLGLNLLPDEVRFDPAVAGRVGKSNWDGFLNQWTLGYGSDRAPVVAMGTEPADTWHEPVDLAWHAGQPLVMLSGGRLDVVRRLIAGSPWTSRLDWSVPRRPYTVHPYDLFPPRRGRGTWQGLAQVVSRQPHTGSELLHRGGPGPSLGDLTYQIDRSAYPSKRWVGGREPTRVRADWLEGEVIPTLRRTARVLLLCGGSGRWGAGWEPVDQPLMRVFLGLPPGAPLELTWDKSSKTELGHLEVDGRLVVSSRALGGSMSRDYLDRLRALVTPYLH